MNGEPLHIRVAELRDQRGWTQKQAAEAAGMSLRAYTNFEAGRSTPQGKNLRGILRAFELDRDEPVEITPVPLASGDMCPTCQRPVFPKDVQTFLNMLGAFMRTKDDDERLEWILEETRHIFSVHNRVDR